MVHHAFLISGTKTICEFWAEIALLPQANGIGRGKLTRIELELYDLADKYNIDRISRSYEFNKGIWKRFPENDEEAITALKRIINIYN